MLVNGTLPGQGARSPFAERRAAAALQAFEGGETGDADAAGCRHRGGLGQRRPARPVEPLGAWCQMLYTGPRVYERLRQREPCGACPRRA